jgi:hypothetical protein
MLGHEGQITLTGTTTAGDTVKGNNTLMGFCYNPTMAAQTSHSTTGQVTLSVAPTTCGTTSTQLPDSSTYQVALQKDNATVDWHRTSPRLPGFSTARTTAGCPTPRRP